jgi:hypothetical protein
MKLILVDDHSDVKDIILDIFMDIILDIFMDVILDIFMDSGMSSLMSFQMFQCRLLTVIFEFILHSHKLKDFILLRRLAFLKTFYLAKNVLKEIFTSF